MNDFNDYTQGTSTNHEETLTLDKINDMMKLLRRAINSCPIKKKMIEQNCNPDDGWVMVVPEGNISTPLPGYVIESGYISEAYLINTSIMESKLWRV